MVSSSAKDADTSQHLVAKEAGLLTDTDISISLLNISPCSKQMDDGAYLRMNMKPSSAKLIVSSFNDSQPLSTQV